MVICEIKLAVIALGVNALFILSSQFFEKATTTDVSFRKRTSS